MAKRHELQLERHAAAEGIAELREEEIDNRVHAGDAIQTRPERPGFLRRMRLLGGTAAVMVAKIATGEIEETKREKSGRTKSGKAGGRARAEKLSSEKRRRIAKMAAGARWK